jgi:hypothetical protein
LYSCTALQRINHLLEYMGERRYASEKKDKKEMLVGKQERLV